MTSGRVAIMTNTWTGNNRIFRTYLKGGGKDGKRCVDRHKGISSVRTWENASQFDCFGGVLQEGFIDISFDDKDMSEHFLNMAESKQWRCLALMNPANGHLHTYWKDTKHRISKDGETKTLACGLVADLHSGDTYIPLRVNGVDRFPPEYDILPGEEYQEVPDELIPVNTNIRLWQSKEGDGRNSDLYGYILVLQSQMQMTDDQIRAMYREVINPFILGDKLSDNELDVILRDESFEKQILPSFWNGSKFKHEVFSEYLQKQFHIRRFNNMLYVYRPEHGIYAVGNRYIEEQMVKAYPGIKASQRREVLTYLNVIVSDEDEQDSCEDLIAFKNGVLNRVTGELMDFSPEYFITNKIPWNYNPAAFDQAMSDALDQWACGDQQIRALLEELTGYCFYRNNCLKKSFILTGSGNNGKSAFFNVLKFLLGKPNYSALDIGELDDRFSTVMLAGKLANIGDDISSDFLEGKTLAIFKKAVSGNAIKAEYKGFDAFDFEPYTKLLFSANEIPRMKSRGFDAIKSRLLIIPFNARFREDDEHTKTDIAVKLKTNAGMEYLIQCGLNGLNRALNHGFTKSQKVQDEVDAFEKDNSPLIGWLDTLADEDDPEQQMHLLLNESVDDLYRRYQVYCQEGGFRPVTDATFSKEIVKRFNFSPDRKRRTVKGKKHSFFQR